VEEDASWEGQSWTVLGTEGGPVTLRHGEQYNADRGQIGSASMLWKGGGESSQFKRSLNPTRNKNESNVCIKSIA
jgi:hypothetical protein